jgi:hypothetical protein
MLPLFFLLAVFAWDAKFKVRCAIRRSSSPATVKSDSSPATENQKYRRCFLRIRTGLHIMNNAQPQKTALQPLSSSILTVIALTRLHQGIKPFLQANPAPAFSVSDGNGIVNLIIYPPPKGRSPVEQEDLAEPPNVVDQKGLTYAGIHEFQSRMSWSPDFQRIAFIDCVYDWTANQPSSLSAGDGVESNRRCSVAVVSRKGEASLFPLKRGRKQ